MDVRSAPIQFVPFTSRINTKLSRHCFHQYSINSFHVPDYPADKTPPIPLHPLHHFHVCPSLTAHLQRTRPPRWSGSRGGP